MLTIEERYHDVLAIDRWTYYEVFRDVAWYLWVLNTWGPRPTDDKL